MKVQKINTVSYKRLFWTVKDNFLFNNIELDADVNYFFQYNLNIKNALNEFYTLLIDLKKSEKEIWENIYHRTQTEIQSFLNNTEYIYSIKNNLPEIELNVLINQFNAFASNKNIRKAEKERLIEYNKQGILAVSKIVIESKIVWINIYRFTNDRATNLSSFGPSSNNINSSLIGKAHRALHWLDILEFKKINVDMYDFCGWYNGTTDKELLNINKFKGQFTQNKIKEYSGVIYKNKLLAFLKKLK